MLGIKSYITLVIIAVCFVSLAIMARNWSCRPRPKPRIRVEPFQVVRATTGATLECSRWPQGRRTFTVTLADIAAPVDGPLAEQSRANLEKIAGKTIRVETERHGLFRGESKATAEAPEARGPIVGVVIGETGMVLQESQLRMGFAKIAAGATVPSAWRQAEKAAQKNKLGVWK